MIAIQCEKSSGEYLGLICDELLTCRGLNSYPGHFDSFIFILLFVCIGGRCDMVGSDEDLGRSRRPGVQDLGWSSTGRALGGRTIERSGDAVCGLYRAQGGEERRFLGLGLKTKIAMVCRLRHKPNGRMTQRGARVKI
jgi:hypothetical protein